MVLVCIFRAICNQEALPYALPYSMMRSPKYLGWLYYPQFTDAELKLREAKGLAQRHVAGRWLSLNSDLLFLVCVRKWPLHLIGPWYKFDE